jgi:hypothetical protein
MCIKEEAPQRSNAHLSSLLHSLQPFPSLCFLLQQELSCYFSLFLCNSKKKKLCIKALKHSVLLWFSFGSKTLSLLPELSLFRFLFSTLFSLFGCIIEKPEKLFSLSSLSWTEALSFLFCAISLSVQQEKEVLFFSLYSLCFFLEQHLFLGVVSTGKSLSSLVLCGCSKTKEEEKEKGKRRSPFSVYLSNSLCFS